MIELENSGLSDSRFNMWRTLFALTHADNIITPEELEFMTEALDKLSLTRAQYDQLVNDMAAKQDIEALFKHVTDLADREQFFAIAYTLANIDGDFAGEERDAILRLRAEYMEDLNLDGFATPDHNENALRQELKDLQLVAPQKGENVLLSLLKKIF